MKNHSSAQRFLTNFCFLVFFLVAPQIQTLAGGDLDRTFTTGAGSVTTVFSTFIFDGITPQTIGAALNFNNLTINNAAGANTATINGVTEISGDWTLSASLRRRR